MEPLLCIKSIFQNIWLPDEIGSILYFTNKRSFCWNIAGILHLFTWTICTPIKSSLSAALFPIPSTCLPSRPVPIYSKKWHSRCLLEGFLLSCTIRTSPLFDAHKECKSTKYGLTSQSWTSLRRIWGFIRRHYVFIFLHLNITEKCYSRR